MDSPEVLARIEAGMAWLQPIAVRVQRAKGRMHPLEDLVGYGHLGLLKAARAFDGRGSWRHFASAQIEFAILDGLRVLEGGRRDRADKKAAALAAGTTNAKAERLLPECGTATDGEMIAVSPTTSPEMRAFKGEVSAVMRAKLRELPEAQARIVERVLDGTSLQEAARDAGVSRDAVDRTRRTLADAVKKLLRD